MKNTENTENMENMESMKMNEKEVLSDLLESEKAMTGNYNLFCCESATESVRNCLMNLLEDEHRMQVELFNAMSEKGYYPVAKAEAAKVEQARMKFAE